MPAKQFAPVEFEVELQPARHELFVRMHVRKTALQQFPLRLEIPTWVPGDYEFMPFARDLFEFEAKNEKGDRLVIGREGWQALNIMGAAQEVHLTYKAYCYAWELSEASGIVDHEFALLLGTRYFKVAKYGGQYKVAYKIPTGWQYHHASGPSKVRKQTAWIYEDYEELLDTPIAFGNYEIETIKVESKKFHFLFLDKSIGFGSMKKMFLDEMAAVITQTYKVFKKFPFYDYTFFLTFNPKVDWGLEHLSSTSCALSPDTFIDPVQMSTAVRVCVHELFHAWNVRRLRPEPFKHLDLSHGSYTEGLWLAEGFTRYYEFLLSVRSGALLPDQFFSSIINYYQHLIEMPAYRRVTARDASLATYLNHTGRYAGHCNNSIDYYNKGMLLAFSLDAELRMLKSGEDSLDTALRELYKAFVDSKNGYTQKDVETFFNARRKTLGTRLVQQVAEPAKLQITEILENLGFKVLSSPIRYFGIVFNDEITDTIANVLDESPAGLKGLAPGDKITAIETFPFSAKALVWAASQRSKITLQVLRGNRTLTFSIKPASREHICELKWGGSLAQLELIQKWIDRGDYKLKPGDSIDLSFYENFHGLEIVV